MSWRAAGALILLTAAFALGWYSGSLSGRLTAASRSADLALSKLDDVLSEREADQKARKKLQDTLDRMPRAERKVRNAVAANPSKCDRPAAVADSVQAAIDSSNTSRKVSGNP